MHITDPQIHFSSVAQCFDGNKKMELLKGGDERIGSGQHSALAADCTPSSSTSAAESADAERSMAPNPGHGHGQATPKGASTSRKLKHSANMPLNLKNKQLMMRVANMPAHVATSYRMRTIAQHISGCLQRYGWAVVDNFLGEPQSLRIIEEARNLYNSQLFADGQLVKPASAAHSQSIRSDKILWWDALADANHSFIGFLLSVIDSVIYSSSPQLAPYKIQGRSRAMIACYPGNGSHYVTHVDNPDRDGRCITSIYYLNKDWQAEHGGELRLYPESSDEPVDIQPLFDRLLFFWSDRRNPHEVLPVHKDRFAITVWYFDTEEKASYAANELQVSVKPKHVIDKVLNWDSKLPPSPPQSSPPSSPGPPSPACSTCSQTARDSQNKLSNNEGSSIACDVPSSKNATVPCKRSATEMMVLDDSSSQIKLWLTPRKDAP